MWAATVNNVSQVFVLCEVMILLASTQQNIVSFSGKNEDPQPTNPGQARIEKRKKGRSNVLFELLLLGADGSGKSTFIRQMQYIHGHGFNDIERQDMIPFIHANIIDALKILVNQMTPWVENTFSGDSDALFADSTLILMIPRDQVMLTYFKMKIRVWRTGCQRAGDCGMIPE